MKLRSFLDSIFNCISVEAKFCILIQISQKFFYKGPNECMSALVQVMARHQGPLSLTWINFNSTMDK